MTAPVSVAARDRRALGRRRSRAACVSGPTVAPRGDAGRAEQLGAGQQGRRRRRARRRRRPRSSAGSTTVTPARIQPAHAGGRAGARPRAASWTRSLTPSVSRGVARRAPRRPAGPSARAIATTSVRYSSPAALSVPSRPSALAQERGVEGVDAGVDLVDRGLLGRRVLAARRWRPPRRRRRARCGRSRVGSASRAVRTVTACRRLRGGAARRAGRAGSPRSAAGRRRRSRRRCRSGAAAAPRSAAARPRVPVPVLVLVGDDDVGGDRGEVGDDRVAAVPHDDHEVLGLERAGGGERVPEQACGRRSRAAPWAARTASGCPRPRRGRSRRPGGCGSRGSSTTAAGRLARDQDTACAPDAPRTNARSAAWTRSRTASLQRAAGCQLPHGGSGRRPAARRQSGTRGRCPASGMMAA